MEHLNKSRKWLITSAIAIGVTAGAAGIATAATRTTAAPIATGTVTKAPATSNENTTHEKTESAARETAEKNGHGFGGPQGPEAALTGTIADHVKAAALKAVPGATVVSVESDRSGTRYEANLTNVDGTTVKLMLDKTFKVVVTDVGGDHGGPGDTTTGTPGA